MRLARFTTVRGRLLALLIGIALPIALLTAVTAFTTYNTVTSAIEASQMRAADDFAVRTRVWYRGALRALLASGAVLSQRVPDEAGCSAAGGQVLSQIGGYRALLVTAKDGGVCSVSVDPTIARADLEAAAAKLKSSPSIQLWAGADLAQARYDYVTISGKRHLAVYARSEDQRQAFGEGILLIDPELLDNVFDLGEADMGLFVALISRTGGRIVSRGGVDGADGWLPEREVVPQAKERWEARSRDGPTRTYAARMVASPDFYVIASFDDRPAKAARMQFLVLLLAPLLTLTLLCLVYLRAIDRHCVQWLRNIEGAARARATQTTARAVVATDMPADIRSVAEAFNTMIDEQEVRQRKLQTALDDNRFLVRELHHRVKNSLQVVQSYIGLTKRDYRGEARLALADAECRVHVLSAAYRFTLADGEMQPVRVDLFVEDVATMISNLLRQRDQWLTSEVDTQASLSVDRIIPLGFLIVDIASRALRATPSVTLRLRVVDIDNETVEITMEADRDISHSQPPKLFAGLLAQVEAIQIEAPEGKSLGSWRIKHRS